MVVEHFSTPPHRVQDHVQIHKPLAIIERFDRAAFNRGNDSISFRISDRRFGGSLA